MPSTIATTTVRASSKPDLPKQVSARFDGDQFFWSYTEEPHRTRRQAIIKAHPEVRSLPSTAPSPQLISSQVTKLCGPEPLTKYFVLAVVALQLTCAALFRDAPILSLRFLLTAYIIGATANQNLFLAIHEISHNLAFKDPLANRVFAVFANLPIGIPYSAAFRVSPTQALSALPKLIRFKTNSNHQPYHLTHHKSLGVDGLDTDLPTSLEAFFLDSILGKAFFCTFQILFYALRPMLVYKLPLTHVHLFNIVAQISFDLFLVHYFGIKALTYLITSSFLAGSLHPCAGHFIAEHYVFDQSSRIAKATPNPVPITETFYYYGPLNLLTYNVGLHNEHHDFPAIPWTRLPALHEIAKEFYADLPHHTSWTWVIWQFIWDREVGLWCRVKRKEGGRKVGGGSGWKEEELGANEGKVIAGVR